MVAAMADNESLRNWRSSVRQQLEAAAADVGDDGRLFEHVLVFDMHEPRGTAYALGDSLVLLDRTVRRAVLIAMPHSSDVTTIRSLGTDLLEFVEGTHGNSVDATVRLHLERLRHVLNDNQGVLAMLALLQATFGPVAVEVPEPVVEQVPAVVDPAVQETEFELYVERPDGTRVHVRLTTREG